MIILTPFQISTLITACASLFLGLFVFIGNKKSKLNFAWLLTSISISAWSIGLFGVVFFADKGTAWFWQYILDIGGICVPLLYFNFLLYLTKKDKKLLWLQILSLATGTFLIALNFEKKGIQGYLGPGVFAEIAFALGLNMILEKQIDIRYLNPIDVEKLPYSDELKLWQKLGWIKIFGKKI